MNLYKILLKYTSNTLPRRFHCYCIGAAKTATTTVSAMVSDNYQSLHEADIEITNRTIIAYLENAISEAELEEFLKNRDRKLHLELESTHSLIYVSKQLADLFPEALFLVTVREPMAWLRSRLNFHFKKHPAEWEEYRQFFWMNKVDKYAPEEALLKQHELAPLHIYLEQYAEHYQLVSEYIPDDRCLMLRTDQISGDSEKIATFLGINPGNLRVAQSNAEPNKAAFIDQLDEKFVVQSIWKYTRPIIEKYFPERLAYYQNYDNGNYHGQTKPSLMGRE